MLTTIKLKAKDRSCKAFFGFYFGLSFLEDVQQPLSFCGVLLDTQSDFQIVIERICDDVNISILAGVSLKLPYVSIVTENDLLKSAS